MTFLEAELYHENGIGDICLTIAIGVAFYLAFRGYSVFEHIADNKHGVTNIGLSVAVGITGSITA